MLSKVQKYIDSFSSGIIYLGYPEARRRAERDAMILKSAGHGY